MKIFLEWNKSETVHAHHGVFERVKMIGASLSEPHTSRTALRKCVNVSACFWPYTINFKWVHSNISRRSISPAQSSARSSAHEGYGPSAASVTQSKVKAHVATSGLCFYRPSMAGRLRTGGEIRTVVEVASGRASHAWHEKSNSWFHCKA